MKLPQREITACLFHSERKQKSKEMGPRRERGRQRPVGPSPQRLPGVRRWILLRWILHREKAGPDCGLFSSSSSGFLVKGSALGKALPTTTVALLLSNPLPKEKKNLCRESRDRDKGPVGNGGWVQELSEQKGVASALLPGSQSPQFYHGPPSGPWNPEGPAGNLGSGELGL